MYPNNPNQPSNVPGLTNGQAAGLLYGLSTLIPGGTAAVSFGVTIFNTFGGGSGGGGGSGSRWYDLGQETHQN
ncbi:MAG: hypothetical protein ACRDJE_12565 [Dehalococcoidia bacterium]